MNPRFPNDEHDDWDQDLLEELLEEEEEEEEEDEEDPFANMETVLFQGATNGNEPDLRKNAKLVQVGLVPVKRMISDALSRRVGMIRIEPKGNQARVFFMIDGVPYPAGAYPRQQANAIIQMVKLLAGLDIQDRSQVQKGGINAEYDKLKYTLTAISSPAEGGLERLIVHLRNKKVTLEDPAVMGLSQDFKDQVRRVTGHRKGLTVVVGPPLSGLTTMTHAVLRCIDCYMNGIYSIADVDRDMINVTLFEAEEGDTLEQTMIRVVRAEADIMVVDPIKDAESAKLYLDMAERITMFTEMNAKDALAGLGQLLKLTGSPPLVADRVSAIIGFKLIRALCKDCKQAFKPNPKMLQKLGIPPETKLLYRVPPPWEPAEDETEEDEPDPCAKCGGVGYFGMLPLMEVIEMTSGLKDILKSGVDAQKIRAQIKKDGMRNLQQEGLRAAAEGKTSIEELQRVFSGK